MYCSQFVTGYGCGIVYATDQGVVKVELPDMSGREMAARNKPSELQSSQLSAYTAVGLRNYFAGKQVNFTDIPVALDGMTTFQQNTLCTIRKLEFGEIVSYGQVAEMCGRPRAARAVGGALAANPVPVIIPCHRVVASDGQLTGFSAPGGKLTKIALLKLEGVEFKGLLAGSVRVVMHRSSLR
ncbi:MAG: methylated-DNA--[protein]-cysteine S-methyltransferase [Desulfuromonadaceae bacterium]|nr:methylated-DNA--[protein]-cysteine S-methyltransferase [Desulfuromonadaceae bacterium]MDD5106404.1 methylated-DNA--[protein]-cysteine S-methyltransferase [Desulfuromonadaceae bacterium]